METNIYRDFQNALILALASGHTQSGGGATWSNAETLEFVEAREEK